VSDDSSSRPECFTGPEVQGSREGLLAIERELETYGS
jgi:hypothetical protein